MSKDSTVTTPEQALGILYGLEMFEKVFHWGRDLGDMSFVARNPIPQFRKASRDLLARAIPILKAIQPASLRGLHYQIAVQGIYKNTRSEYQKLSRLTTKARECELIPWDWIVDNIRETLKPSSWSGLADFAGSVRDCYRKDFWARMPAYPVIFVEKDAMAGVIEPVTAQYDIPLQVVRGYVSSSFAHKIAEQWTTVADTKPIFAYYLGDFDPSGFDLERNLREKLARYSGLKGYTEPDRLPHIELVDPGKFRWERLAVNEADFEEFTLLPMMAKKSDPRYKRFVREHGHDCAELDAIPADALRKRVEQAIVQHIDHDEWERLLQVEAIETQTVDQLVQRLEKADTESNSD